ncbi:MAG TPA: type II secretion system protein [Candidatus Dojkabacteria bacterium]|nr:type II secretion system protein [Candidatus Dojkabacteria bacterium]
MRKYTAYTLIEMLIVLGIFVILVSLGTAAFAGLRDTVSLNQDVLNLEQDQRNTKRQSLILERNSNERWIYGLGLDFTGFTSQKKYTIFKWCSQFPDYGDVKTTAIMPNYDSALAVSQLNGNLPVTSTYVNNNCITSGSQNEIVRLQGALDGSVSSNFTTNIPSSNDAAGDVGGVPVYIVFESVSGKTFFYDINGKIVNYDTNGNMVSNPINFVAEITSNNTRVKKTITISNISGKIDVTSTNL